eukprot:5789323-Prymnesium_polylepis.1
MTILVVDPSSSEARGNGYSPKIFRPESESGHGFEQESQISSSIVIPKCRCPESARLRAWPTACLICTHRHDKAKRLL